MLQNRTQFTRRSTTSPTRFLVQVFLLIQLLCLRNGVPTDEQSKAYIAMLAATAGVSADLKPETIFDFTLAGAAAKELTGKR